MKKQIKIEEQKSVARLVLEILKFNNYKAKVAGGAPRDWFFDEKAKDIDIFIEQTYNENIITFLLKKFITLKLICNNNYKDEYYNSEKEYQENHINTVIETEYFGQTIQFILINITIERMIKDKFSSSIQKATFDGENLMYSSEFIDSIETQTINYKDEVQKDNFKIKKDRLNHLKDFKDNNLKENEVIIIDNYFLKIKNKNCVEVQINEYGKFEEIKDDEENRIVIRIPTYTAKNQIFSLRWQPDKYYKVIM